MAPTQPGQPIILYHYAYSPYARRVVWYLAFRGIPYSQCLQPPLMPRPDLALLGIKHRRIPLLAIGRDVYLDTRLILSKLDALVPPSAAHPSLAPPSPDQKALEALLETHAIDAGLFARGASLIPTGLPLLRDPGYFRDRADWTGNASLSVDSMNRARPEAEVEVARAMRLMETTLLADGRDWVLGGDQPSRADIEAVWPLHWLTGMPGALPKERFSAETYPKVYAWIARFQKAVSAAKAAAPGGKNPPKMDGDAAARTILGAGYAEEDGDAATTAAAVDATDPVAAALGLQAGDVVTVWPVDSGSAHRDVGKLVRLDQDEVVIEIEGPDGRAGGGVRLHAPRHGFRVRKGRAEAESETPKL